jgi:hypothetical protein
VAIVRLELWPAVTEPGVNVSVVPLGAPLAVNATVWALPEVMFVAMVVTACCPAVAVTELGVAVRAKSSAMKGLTVSETVVVWVADGPVPVMVMG